MAKHKKKPHSIIVPTPEKRPRTASGTVLSFDGRLASWHLSRIDFEGPWGCGFLTRDVIRAQIHPKIRSFEGMTWGEIKTSDLGHSVPCQHCCAEARKRLRELEADDVDELFRLRLTGKQRIWGIMDRGVLNLLWWDPSHTVCPSEPRHT
jgi:hypothetical protein